MRKKIENAAKVFFEKHDGDMDKYELGLHEWSMRCFVAGYEAAQLPAEPELGLVCPNCFHEYDMPMCGKCGVAVLTQSG